MQGSGYFAVNRTLTLEAILQLHICDRSILIINQKNLHPWSTLPPSVHPFHSHTKPPPVYTTVV